MIKEPEDPTQELHGNDRYEGYAMDLANEIAQLVNFTFEFHLVKDEKYGALEEDGKWNGMVGELIRHVSEK